MKHIKNVIATEQHNRKTKEIKWMFVIASMKLLFHKFDKSFLTLKN